MTPPVTASAPGKVILFGEHAVVYGRPAIAVPVTDVQATARITPNPGGGLRLRSLDLDEDAPLGDLAPDHPIGALIRATLAELGQPDAPGLPLVLEISSTIPIAAGLGSGAAVSTAIVRALASYFGHPLPAPDISRLVFEAEKRYHGAPSGIDNTVIAHGRPVYFVRDQTLQPFHVPVPFTLAIGDTGVASPTKITVGNVRAAWQADRGRYEALFDQAAEIARQARAAIEAGQPHLLGALMNRNQTVLEAMGVSSAELERLVAAARSAGAPGAKLSGGGGGGNMIAWVEENMADGVADALRKAGARRVIVTRVGETGRGDRRLDESQDSSPQSSLLETARCSLSSNSAAR